MKIPLFETDKKIALGFSCNNNTEEEITRALDPWIDHVDLIIAVEGRYRIPYSPEMMKGYIPPKYGENTYEILEKHYPGKLYYHEYYGEQKKKRHKYLDIAASLRFDAVIVWDTDEIITDKWVLDREYGQYKLDWDRFYRRIALAHEFIEGEAGLLDMWSWIPDEQDWPRQHNKVDAHTWKRWHRIHLNPHKQKYILNHYTFAERDVTDEQVIEFSSKEENKLKRNPYLLYPMGDAEGVRFTTDRKLRSPEQNKFGHDYAWQLTQEENYRAYMVELKVLVDDKTYKEQYREPFTYWFDHNGRPQTYTKEEQEKFNELEL